MSPATPARDPGALRIAMQYRERASMAYELVCNGVEVSVRVTPAASSDDPAAWRIDAQVGRSKDAPCVTGWATTRTEALSEVSRRWASGQTTHGLPVFDWDAAARALGEVRAL